MKAKKKVVYAFMVADLLHRGHVKYIKQSKSLGNYLIVGILTDKATQVYKSKPIMSFKERLMIVKSIKGVDKVVTQHSRDPSVNILKYKPDIVTHGDDWPLETFPAKKAMRKAGAKLVLTKYYKPQSTTKLKAKIKETRSRSLTKSVLWRVLGIIMLGLITFFYTGSLIVTTLITFFHHLIFVFIYYGHERVWNMIDWGKASKIRTLIKTFTYEVLLGVVVLGFISWVLTENFIIVTNIILTYIPLRVVGYYILERIWLNTVWGCTWGHK